MNIFYKRNAFILTAVIFVFFVILLLLQLYRFYFVSLNNSIEPIDYILSKGVTSRAIATDLYSKGLIKNPHFFIIMSRLTGAAQHLQAGGYQITPGMTANQLLDNIAKGKVVVENLTIIEGWTVKQMLAIINHNKYIKHTLKNKSIEQIAKLLAIKQANPEGWFFPDTYHFHWGTTDYSLLQRAHQRMQLHLHQAWQSRASGLPYRSPYQALIVASMVVKEARVPAERPLIAGVILNRLKKRMRLRIDPTVIYGMGLSYQGKITLKALRTPTPYNTYTNYGLPPTPISLPGEASIYAALHPEKSQYLYFVAKGDGHHVFSVTLKQHDAAIRKYILHQG
jgi:UPF0755 protein